MSSFKQKDKEVKLMVGPQHPGITGNMSFEITLEGDTLTDVETHVGYLHRAFEKLMERRTFIQNFPLVCRICVPEPDINEENYARALEDIAGIEIPERAKWIRTLVLEMARMTFNIRWIGGFAGTMGLGTAPQWMIYDRDLVLDLFEELTGARVYHIYILPGGVRRDFPEGFEDRVLKVMDYLESRIPDYDNLIFENSVIKKRTIGISKVKPEWIEALGITGAVARSCGFPYDVRKDQPYEIYDKLDFDVQTREEGDLYSMAILRRHELIQSIDLIRQIIKNIPKGKVWEKLPNVLFWEIPAGETYVKLESARGEFGYYVVTDGSDKPRRVHVRGSSTPAAYPLLKRLVPGMNISDFSLTIVGLQTCPPEIDR